MRKQEWCLKTKGIEEAEIPSSGLMPTSDTFRLANSALNQIIYWEASMAQTLS